MTVYLVSICLLPMLVLLTGILILPTRWFAQHSEDDYLANMGYGMTLQNADCQVLIYGDSSAMLALDPSIIRQATGLTACNIAEFEGVTVVDGTWPVDQFLTRNRRPRYMVFMYAPEDYGPAPEWRRVHVSEAITYRIQHQFTLGTLLLFLRHPAEVLSWAETGTRFAITHARHAPMPEAKMHLRDATRGRLPLDAPPLTGCRAFLKVDPDANWMHHLRTKYAIAGTRVLLDVTPVPACDPAYSFYKGRLQGIADNTLALYPLSDYMNNGRLHMNVQGSKTLSLAIARQIAAQESAR